MMLIRYSVDSDWLFNTQSKVLQADWFIGNFQNINMTYLVEQPTLLFYMMSAYASEQWYNKQFCYK